VRIEVSSFGGKLEYVTVSEIKEGKLFKSEFNSKLEPVAGGTSPPSLVEEHRKELAGFMKGEFFKHAMGTQEEFTTTKIQGVGLEERSISFSKKIVSEMLLEDKMSYKWEAGRDSEGDYLLMTPLKTSGIQARVQKGATSYFVSIPEDMLVIAGLKIGDRITWRLEEGGLFLRKAEGSDEDTRKVIRNNVSAAVTIPEEFVERFGLEKGEYGIWTFDKDEKEKPRLWLELSKENPHISVIYASEVGYIKYKKEMKKQFHASIPYGLGEWLKARDEIILEPKEGKLYIRKKQ
jgi:antitoxin component of MazEF toxin-antitoxin module/transposase